MAVIAAILFAIGLVVHLIRGGGLDWPTFALAGLLCLALAGVVTVAYPWKRQ